MEQLPDFPSYASLPTQTDRGLPHHPSALAFTAQYRQIASIC